MDISEAAVLHRNVPPDWYKRGIKENLGQRFWHFRRFSEVGEFIEPAAMVLDIGCADGVFTKVILDKSKANLVIGIDVLPSSIAYVERKFAKNKKLKFQVASGEKLPFKDEEFDAVFCLEVLEHVFLPEKVLAEIRRVLKKNGYAVFLVPSENLLFKIIWFFWENTKGWIWKGTHIHKFDKEALDNIIKAQGFKIAKKKYFLFGMLEAVKVIKK